MKKIAIVQGHPDPDNNHYCHALAGAYVDGARSAGHEVKIIPVANLEFPLIRTEAEWTHGEVPISITQAQETIVWADHIVIIYPLWMGTMPALLKGFLEQTLRQNFAVQVDADHVGWKRLLNGKSCRIVVTMGMPALAYKWIFRAHSLKSLERNILKFVGIAPIKESLIGLVAVNNNKGRVRWLEKMIKLGAQAK
jgi:putative NADPH-quinone reductase